MKILNYNDHFRNYIQSLKSRTIKNGDYYQSAIEDFYDIIINDDNLYKYLIGLLYETMYIDYKYIYEKCPDDLEALRAMNFLNSIQTIDELVDLVDYPIFYDFCEEVLYFNSLDLYSKKAFIENIKNDKHLSNVFPGYILDICYYLNSYDASCILDDYYEMLNSGVFENELDAFDDTVCCSTEALMNLEKEDFSNYEYILLDMLESYYKYYKYLLSIGKLDDEYDIDILDTIEYDLSSISYFSVNNHTLLKKIIQGYLKYKILPDEEKDIIEKFYDVTNNKKMLAKIIKKSNNLKNKK